jgi:hypothetical protein
MDAPMKYIGDAAMLLQYLHDKVEMEITEELIPGGSEARKIEKIFIPGYRIKIY